MKRTDTSFNKLPLLVLSAFLMCIFFAQASFGAQLAPTTHGFAPDQLRVVKGLGLDVPAWMVGTPPSLDKIKPKPTDPNHPNFPLNCSDYNDLWCIYAYPGDGCCCVPIFQAPNSFCPDICV